MSRPKAPSAPRSIRNPLVCIHCPPTPTRTLPSGVCHVRAPTDDVASARLGAGQGWVLGGHGVLGSHSPAQGSQVSGQACGFWLPSSLGRVSQSGSLRPCVSTLPTRGSSNSSPQGEKTVPWGLRAGRLAHLLGPSCGWPGSGILLWQLFPGASALPVGHPRCPAQTLFTSPKL